MLQAGIKGKKEITVTLDKTAKAMGSGTMDVFATPAICFCKKTLVNPRAG